MDIDPTQLFNEVCLDSCLSDVELKQVCLHYHKYKGNESLKQNKTIWSLQIRPASYKKDLSIFITDRFIDYIGC